MKPDTIRVLKITEDGEIEIKEISNELEVLQEEVGGLIDIPFVSEKLHERSIDVIIDDEGKIKERPPTVAIIDDRSKMLDLLVGPILFTSHDNQGATTGLADSQLEFLQHALKKRLITRFGLLYAIEF